MVRMTQISRGVWFYTATSCHSWVFRGLGLRLGCTVPDMIKLKSFLFPLSTLTYPPGYLIFFPGWEGVFAVGWGKRTAETKCLQWLHDADECISPNSLPLSSSPPLCLPSLPPPLLKPLLTTKVWGTARLRIHTCSTKRSSSLEMWTLTDGSGFQLISVNDTSDAFWNEYLRQY